MVYTVEINGDPYRHSMAATASATKSVNPTSDEPKSRKIFCQVLGVMIGIIERLNEVQSMSSKGGCYSPPTALMFVFSWSRAALSCVFMNYDSWGHLGKTVGVKCSPTHTQIPNVQVLLQFNFSLNQFNVSLRSVVI